MRIQKRTVAFFQFVQIGIFGILEDADIAEGSGIAAAFGVAGTFGAGKFTALTALALP